jgi:hypothetical protein
MASKAIRKAVRDSLKSLQSGESEADVVALIDILADARARAANRSVAAADEQYAGKILCVVFDPVKTNTHRDFVHQLRHDLRGVANSEVLQNVFEQSLTQELLTDPDVKDAITRGPDALFHLPAGARTP